MTVITLSNQKGGVAKTTTSQALTAGLYHRGKRVLGIDLDPQCNFCLSSGVDVTDSQSTLFDVFKRTVSLEDVIRSTAIGYDLIPGGLMLAGADMDFTQTGREYMLSEILEPISDRYDYAVIDTPPTLGILTVNALTASNGVVIPMTPDAYSLQGLSQLNGLIQSTRKYCNRDLLVYGILLTKYNARQNISRALEEMIEKAAGLLGTKLFDTKIRESVSVRESALEQVDFFTEAPNANATVDYNNFINEFLGGIGNGK